MIGDPFTMVVAIVLIVTIGSVLGSKRKGNEPDTLAEHEREIQAVRRRCEEMEHRIRTLERITTDPEHDLDRKISSLR